MMARISGGEGRRGRRRIASGARRAKRLFSRGMRTRAREPWRSPCVASAPAAPGALRPRLRPSAPPQPLRAGVALPLQRSAGRSATPRGSKGARLRAREWRRRGNVGMCAQMRSGHDHCTT